ncbi:MAG: hypothetical protein JXR64_07910, partial [Spirochaetales bacterium]|nr:hypothetical protein [Spirochaetales bacterium]
MKNYLIFLILLLFALLSSCSKHKDQNLTNPEISVYLDTIIQDWEGQKEFINEFNRLTNSSLLITQPPHQQYMDKLLLSFSDVSAPDICEILPEYLSIFISKEYIIPLNNLI